VGRLYLTISSNNPKEMGIVPGHTISIFINVSYQLFGSKFSFKQISLNWRCNFVVVNFFLSEH